MRPLFVGWRGNRNDLVRPGIERPGDSSDGAPLARRVPAFEHEDRRNAAFLRLALQQVQPALITLELGGERFLGDRLRHVERAEDRRLRHRTLPARAGSVPPVATTASCFAAPDAGCACRRRSSRGAAAVGKCFADGIPDRRRDRQASVGLVHAFDDRPGCNDGAGALQRALRGCHEAVVEAPVFPLQRAHPPSREGILYERPKARLLRRFRQVHPELQDQRAVIGECALEAGDALELLVEVGAAAAAVDAIEHGREYHELRNRAMRPCRGRSRQ